MKSKSGREPAWHISHMQIFCSYLESCEVSLIHLQSFLWHWTSGEVADAESNLGLWFMNPTAIPCASYVAELPFEVYNIT